MFSLKQGEFLVKSARKAIEFFLPTGVIKIDLCPDKKLEEKFPVFVSIKNFNGELRGLMGLLEPKKSLWKSTIIAALNAAFKDPRFSPVKSNDLDKIKVQVSIITNTRKLDGERTSYVKKIKLGKHGLKLERGKTIAILMPEDPINNNWTVEQFLEETCKKANLLKTSWKEKRTTLYIFEMQTFIEETPKGNVIEITN